MIKLSVNENRLAAFSIIWRAFLFVGVFFVCSASVPAAPPTPAHISRWCIASNGESPDQSHSCHSAVSNPASGQWMWTHSSAMGHPLFSSQINSWDQSKKPAKSVGVTTRPFLRTQMFASSWHVIWGWRKELHDAFQVMGFKPVLLKDHRPQGMQGKFPRIFMKPSALPGSFHTVTLLRITCYVWVTSARWMLQEKKNVNTASWPSRYMSRKVPSVWNREGQWKWSMASAPLCARKALSGWRTGSDVAALWFFSHFPHADAGKGWGQEEKWVA